MSDNPPTSTTRDRLLAVIGDTFDLQSIRPEIEAVAADFGEYLAQARTGGSSKHRALGAVGKALQQARTVRGEALLGYARRVHEQLTGGRVPFDAVRKLDDGIRKLDTLLTTKNVPARLQGEVLSRIDYATYFDVRRRQAEFFEGWTRFATEAVARLGLDAQGVPASFGKARKGDLGDKWRAATDEYLSQRRLAVPLTDTEEDD